jgi:hypothetical protein
LLPASCGLNIALDGPWVSDAIFGEREALRVLGAGGVSGDS